MLDRRTLLLGAAVLPALGACAERPRLRIGYQNGLLLIAKARGDLDKVARVEWRSFPSGPPLLEAMSIGALDVGGAGDTPPVAAAAQGAPIVLIAAQRVTGAAAAIVVPEQSPLRRVADLRGRRVAWLRGSSAETFVSNALDSAGLAPTDVEAVNLAPGDAAAAFASGSLDAWAVWDPYFALAEERGARVLVGGAPLAASISFLVASAGAARDRADALVAVLDALKATSAWATANRGALAGLLARDANLPPPVAARVAARQDLGLEPLTPQIIATEQRLADMLFAEGQIPARVDVKKLQWDGWRG